LAALDVAEAETGQDLSALRAWIAENPGLVLAVARGEQPPHRLAPTPGSSQLAGKVLPIIAKKPAAQDQHTDVDAYLTSLVCASFDAAAVWSNFFNMHYEWDPDWERTKNTLFDRMVYSSTLYLDQEVNCRTYCNFQCRIDCGSGKGACFTNFPQISPCHESSEQECGFVGGVFYLGQTCPGSCWVSAGGVSGCTEMDEKSCREWPSKANLPGHGSDLTILAFCPSQACSEPMCSQPVP